MKKPSLINSLFYGLMLVSLASPCAAIADEAHKDHEGLGNSHESDNSQNESNANDNNDNGGKLPVRVPEPATMTLLGVGLVGLAAKFRNRR